MDRRTKPTSLLMWWLPRFSLVWLCDLNNHCRLNKSRAL